MCLYVYIHEAIYGVWDMVGRIERTDVRIIINVIGMVFPNVQNVIDSSRYSCLWSCRWVRWYFRKLELGTRHNEHHHRNRRRCR